MKKLIITIAIGLLTQRVTQAQGTVYLSNVSQASVGGLAVGSDSWVGTLFVTGDNTGGYVLDSIQLGMADAAGNPNGFAVMLYAQSNNSRGAFPGSSLDTLSGSDNPFTAGIYTFTPTSSLMLTPQTSYYLVLTAGASISNGAYEWNYENTASYNPIDSWGGGGTALGSSNGSSWRQLGPPFDYPQFAITATAIPEPSSLALLGLSSGIFIYVRRKFQRF